MILRISFFFLLTLSSFVLAQTAKVKIIVHSAPLPENEKVFITGNILQLGNWSPDKISLCRVNATTWKFETTVPLLSHLEFKITRGSWNTEAIYQHGKIPQNIILKVEHDTTIFLNPIMWADSVKQPEQKNEITGIIKFHRQLSDSGLRYAHDIIVRLPASYEKFPQKHYPVLYMHDGQNLFDPNTSFAGFDWRIDEVIDSLVTAKEMEEIIVVGIYNSPDRIPEYSDSELGRAYAGFIVHTVKPLIDSTYRTKPERKNTAIMGSSMGGLISFLAAQWYPDLFSKAGAMSPSFWFDNEKTIREFRDKNLSNNNLQLYLDCGGKEKELLPGFKEMISLLEKKGFKKGTDLEYFLDENAVHNEQSWSHRVWRPLLFFFGKK